MKFLDIKVIEGGCKGFGSWIDNPINTPGPGDIFYYKPHHYGHHGHQGHHSHYQRGGSRKTRGKSRKYIRKYKSKSKSKSKSNSITKRRINRRTKRIIN